MILETSLKYPVFTNCGMTASTAVVLCTQTLDKILLLLVKLI